MQTYLRDATRTSEEPSRPAAHPTTWSRRAREAVADFVGGDPGRDRVRREHDDAQLPARARGRAHARARRRDRRRHGSTTTRTSHPGCSSRRIGASWCVRSTIGRARRDLDLDALEGLLNERTRIVAFTLASNAVGTVTDARARRRARAARRRAGLGRRRALRAASADRRALARGSTCCSARRTSSSGRTSAALRAARTCSSRCPPTGCARRTRTRPGHRFETGTPATRRSPARRRPSTTSHRSAREPTGEPSSTTPTRGSAAYEEDCPPTL